MNGERETVRMQYEWEKRGWGRLRGVKGGIK